MVGESEDSATRMEFSADGFTCVLFINTIKPLKDLMQGWREEGLIPFKAEASVRVTLIGLVTAYNEMLESLKMAERNPTYSLPKIDFNFEGSMPDEQEVVCTGFSPVATVTPLRKMIAEWAPTITILNPKVGVRRNMIALYEAVCVLQNRYKKECAKRIERSKFAAESTFDVSRVRATYKDNLLGDLIVFERDKTRQDVIRSVVSPEILPLWDEVKKGLFAKPTQNLMLLCNANIQLMEVLTTLHIMQTNSSLREPPPFKLEKYINLKTMKGVATPATELVLKEEENTAFQEYVKVFSQDLPVINSSKRADQNIEVAYKSLNFLLDQYIQAYRAYRKAVEGRRENTLNNPALNGAVDVLTAAEELWIV